jgi:hypothetical protein
VNPLKNPMMKAPGAPSPQSYMPDGGRAIATAESIMGGSFNPVATAMNATPRKGLMPAAPPAQPMSGSDRARQMIADAKARKDAKRTEMQQRAQAMPRGLMSR